MRKKRILPFLLSLLILCSSLQLPVDAKEMDASGKQDTTNMESEISVQGTDSFGNMVAEAIDNKVEQQEENEGCNIFEITMSGIEAEVDFETNKDASLVVGIYDEAGIKMVASGHAEVTTDEKTVKINIEDGQLPDYYYVKGFLVDPETYEPYCTAYETPNYTREMQEFFSKTTEDFAGHEILNLDDDTTNNFAVYADGTYVVKESESEVKLSEKDEDAGKYVFENADEAFLALKSGDILSYECADGSLVIIKIDSVSVKGKTVTLYDKDTEMEDVFDYVKIDSEASTEEATVDASTCGEGVTYNGLVDSDEIAPQKIDVDVSDSKSHSFELKNNDITGSFKLQMKTGLKLYITSSYRYLELRMDYTKSVSISIKKKCKKEFPLITLGYSPVPGVYIEVKPVFVVEGSGKVSLNGTLKGTIGCAVESDTGIRNLTSMPSFETELKGEVTVFIGISLEPKVKVLSDEVAMVGASAQVGGEANATLAKDKGDSQKHMCKTCIEGTINAKGEVNFKVSFFNNDKLTYTQGTSLKAKIGEFYYSEDFNEFAFTTCPHISYRIIVTVKNKQGQVVKDVLVNNENKTDQNGQATLYLPNGTHTLTVTSQKGTELGNKEITVKDSAKKVEVEVDDNVIDGLKVEQVSLCRYHSGAITEDGSLWMWGSNSFGALGNGTYMATRNAPIKIMENVKAISLGSQYSGAIKEDGSLWMWGDNDFGQLGNGTTVDSMHPINITDQFNQTQQLTTDEPAANIALQSTPPTTSFKNLNPNGIYNFYIMKDKETQQPFDNGNLLYINQYQAQSDGTLSVNYETTGDTSNAEAFVVGGNTGDESQEMKFKDVSKNDWFYSSVMYVNKNGLMTGLNETEFGPVQSLARAQFAMILYRMNGSPAVDYTNKFKDVSSGIWYTDPIMWASNKGVVTGYSNGNFGPGDNINREQMAVMMYRYAKTQGYDVSASVALGNYKDGANVSGFAKQAMQWCVAEGIITGKYNGTQLDPQGNAIRAECATIIRRFVEKYE